MYSSISLSNVLAASFVVMMHSHVNICGLDHFSMGVINTFENASTFQLEVVLSTF
jgi:hypothetical protein